MVVPVEDNVGHALGHLLPTQQQNVLPPNPRHALMGITAKRRHAAVNAPGAMQRKGSNAFHFVVARAKHGQNQCSQQAHRLPPDANARYHSTRANRHSQRARPPIPVSATSLKADVPVFVVHCNADWGPSSSVHQTVARANVAARTATSCSAIETVTIAPRAAIEAGKMPHL